MQQSGNSENKSRTKTLDTAKTKTANKNNENTPANPNANDAPYTLIEIKTPANDKVNPSIMESFDDVVVHGGA